MKTDSEDQLRSRGIGVLVLGLFGGLWVFLALLERGHATPLYLTALAAVVFAYLAAAVWLLRLSRSLPREPEDRARSRAFLRINAIAWTSAIAAYLLLHMLRRDVDFLPVLAIIAGLHFIPLGRLFGNIPQIGTGIFMTLWAVVALLFLPTENLASTTCFGCGLILWQSATMTVAVACDAVWTSRRLRPSLNQP